MLSLFSLAAYHGQECMEQNLDVDLEREILYIQDVISQTLYHLVDIRGIPVLDHSPRCQAGPDEVQQRVVRCPFDDAAYEMFALGPGAYKRHLTHKDIPQVGQLVKAVFAHETSHGGDTRVVVR